MGSKGLLTPVFIRILQAHGLSKCRRVFPLMPHHCGELSRPTVIRISVPACPRPAQPQRRIFRASLRIQGAGAQAAACVDHDQ